MSKICDNDTSVLRQRLEEFVSTRRGDGKDHARRVVRAVAVLQALSPTIRGDMAWVPHRAIFNEVNGDIPHKKTVYRLLQDFVKEGIFVEDSDDLAYPVPVKRKRYYRIPLVNPLEVLLSPEEMRFYVPLVKERENSAKNYIQRNIALDMLRENGIEFPEREMQRRYAKRRPKTGKDGYLLAALILIGGPGFVSTGAARGCEECGADISTLNKSAKFCSARCRQANHRKTNRG